jgi:hypothetical protein
MSVREGFSTKRRMRKGGTTLPFDQRPAFLLDAAFSGVEEKELTALLQLRVTCGGNVAPIVIVGVL